MARKNISISFLFLKKKAHWKKNKYEKKDRTDKRVYQLPAALNEATEVWKGTTVAKQLYRR